MSNTTSYLNLKIATHFSLKAIIRPPLQYFECKAKNSTIVSRLWDPICFMIIVTMWNCIKSSKIGCDLAGDCKLAIIKLYMGKVKNTKCKLKILK